MLQNTEIRHEREIVQCRAKVIAFSCASTVASWSQGECHTLVNRESEASPTSDLARIAWRHQIPHLSKGTSSFLISPRRDYHFSPTYFLQQDTLRPIRKWNSTTPPAIRREAFLLDT